MMKTRKFKRLLSAFTAAALSISAVGFSDSIFRFDKEYEYSMVAKAEDNCLYNFDSTADNYVPSGDFEYSFTTKSPNLTNENLGKITKIDVLVDMLSIADTGWGQVIYAKGVHGAADRVQKSKSFENSPGIKKYTTEEEGIIENADSAVVQLVGKGRLLAYTITFNDQTEVKSKDNWDIPEFYAPTAITGLIADGTKHQLITAPKNSVNAQFEYRTDNTTWSSEIPAATDEGEYTVYYRVKVGTNDTYTPLSGEEGIKVKIGHNFTYEANGSTITATCSANNCSLTNNKASLTIAAPAELAYDGTAKAAALTGDTEKFTLPNIVYKKGNVTLDSAPVEPGSYTASITLGSATASVSYTITNDPVNVNVTTTGETEHITASLMKNDCSTAPADFKLEAGESCILGVNCDEGYDYTLSLGGNIEKSNCIKPFTIDEYKEYAKQCKKTGNTVSADIKLYKITVSPTGGQALNISVKAQEAKTYTILYQPNNTSSNEVWCNFTMQSEGSETPFVIKMQKDSQMNSVDVWSAKVSAAFEISKIAFSASKAPLDASAITATVTCKQSVTNDSDWSTITNTNDKYVVVGGNAKTVIAAFVSDGAAVAVYNQNDIKYNKATATQGVTYELAVCQTDSSGNITTGVTVSAPTPTKEGYTFLHWRTIEDKQEKTYNAGDPVTLKENMTFNAVWKKITPTVKFDLNGGTGDNADKNLNYAETLSISNPTREGYAFAGWTVAESVTENGRAYSKGAAFDIKTPITADLELVAQWKHVHVWGCYEISKFGDNLKVFQSLSDKMHVKICSGCRDMGFEPHRYDSKGYCICGYRNPDLPPEKCTVVVSYGIWSNNTYTNKFNDLDRTVTADTEVSVEAPVYLGENLKFSKWQYSPNGNTWRDFTTDIGIGFTVPCDIYLRALYVNPVKKPEVNLSARTYETPVEQESKTYYMDTLLFQMDYKLPDGYTYVDSGIKMGDNDGISYYELKERTYSFDAEAKAIATSMCVVVSILSGGIETYDSSATETYYASREDSVLNIMSATELSKYMLNSKPVNVEKYPPIYWVSKPDFKKQYGSIYALAPVRFAQMNNCNHYMYGMAYLQYKDKNGNLQTIYTDAIPATVNDVDKVLNNTYTKQGS